MDRDTFVCDENWFGSYYELAIELGPTGDDERLCTALEHVWSLPQLRGSWIAKSDFDLQSSPIECRDGIVFSRYGVITLTSEISVGCVTHTVREPDGSDWLDLCIPTGMLGHCYDVQYPLDCATNPWMVQIDRLFAQMAASVFRSIPFQLAIIGEEVSGITHAATITSEDCRFCPFLLPELLWQRLGLSSSRQVLTPGLIAIGLGDS